MENRFEGKVVLITGSSSGIGKGAALFFAQSGAKVVLASRNEKANLDIQNKILSSGQQCSYVKTDVANSADARRMVDHAVQRFGKLDIAVNNAGIEGTPMDKTADYQERVWDEVMDVNLKGVWLSMKYELPALLENGGGSIINISSLAGLRGGDAGIAYHASKFGVVGATKAAAIEYAGQNIRINAVCPAVIETPMAERAFSDQDRKMRAEGMHPVGRFGKVDEVVHTLAWLADDRAAFITGTAIPVDGGVSC